VQSVEEAVSQLSAQDELMIIGGSAIYEMLLPKVDRMYLTYVDAEFEGDAWFPGFDETEWNVVDTVLLQPDEKNKYACRFVTFERKE
jgi:dihydrofolate reductase